MGIRGLKTFIDNNRSTLKRRHRLRDTCLVIDGQNLVFGLFFTSAKGVKHYLYGGDYNRLAASVSHFFETLNRCGVRALVVLDGGVDPTEHKKQTLIRRFNDKLSVASDISNGDLREHEIIASLCKPVLLDVLTQLSVPHIQTPYEADAVIARIANQLQCPVLSDDSDFFVYDLKCGVISAEDLMNSLALKTDSTDPRKPYKYLECELYLIDHLIEYFPTLKREVLPLFAALMGNDYVQHRAFDSILDAIPKRKTDTQPQPRRLYVEGRHTRIIRLLDRLQDWSADVLIDTIKEIARNDRALESLRSSLDDYRTDVSTQDQEIVVDGKDLTVRIAKRDESLPDWFSDQFFECRLSTTLMNVIKLKYDFLNPKVEDHRLESSYTPAQELRQYLFALLRLDDKDEEPVLLYDRIGSEMTTYQLKPLLQTPNGRLLPDLHRIRELPVSDQKLLMEDILSIDEKLLHTIEELIHHEHLNEHTPGVTFLVIAIRYWLTKANHRVWLEFVCALMASIIFTDHIGHYSMVKFFSFAEWHGSRHIDDLRQFNGRPQHSPSLPYQPRVAHFFNEFQDCLRIIRNLNTLLGSPYDMGKPFFCLNGVFIYNLTIELSSCKDPKQRMSDLLGGQSSGIQLLFASLLNTAIDGLDDKLIRCPPLTNRSHIQGYSTGYSGGDGYGRGRGYRRGRGINRGRGGNYNIQDKFSRLNVN